MGSRREGSTDGRSGGLWVCLGPDSQEEVTGSPRRTTVQAQPCGRQSGVWGLGRAKHLPSPSDLKDRKGKTVISLPSKGRELDSRVEGATRCSLVERNPVIPRSYVVGSLPPAGSVTSGGYKG